MGDLCDAANIYCVITHRRKKGKYTATLATIITTAKLGTSAAFWTEPALMSFKKHRKDTENGPEWVCVKPLNIIKFHEPDEYKIHGDIT